MRPAQGQARARRPEGPEGCRADDAVGREATGEQHRARGKGQGAGQPTDRAEGEGRKADRDRRPAAPECAPAPGPDTRRWGEPPGHPKGGEQVSEASAPSRRRPSADAVVGGEAPRVEDAKRPSTPRFEAASFASGRVAARAGGEADRPERHPRAARPGPLRRRRTRATAQPAREAQPTVPKPRKAGGRGPQGPKTRPKSGLPDAEGGAADRRQAEGGRRGVQPRQERGSGP